MERPNTNNNSETGSEYTDEQSEYSQNSRSYDSVSRSDVSEVEEKSYKEPIKNISIKPTPIIINPRPNTQNLKPITKTDSLISEIYNEIEFGKSNIVTHFNNDVIEVEDGEVKFSNETIYNNNTMEMSEYSHIISNPNRNKYNPRKDIMMRKFNDVRPKDTIVDYFIRTTNYKKRK